MALITGAGDRAFCSGIDLKEEADRQRTKAPATNRNRALPYRTVPYRTAEIPLFRALEQCQKPIIAPIDGWCLAAGFEIALLCYGSCRS